MAVSLALYTGKHESAELTNLGTALGLYTNVHHTSFYPNICLLMKSRMSIKVNQNLIRSARSLFINQRMKIRLSHWHATVLKLSYQTEQESLNNIAIAKLIYEQNLNVQRGSETNLCDIVLVCALCILNRHIFL